MLYTYIKYLFIKYPSHDEGVSPKKKETNTFNIP